MLTDELQALAEQGFMNATDAAITFKRELEAGQAESKNFFSNIIGEEDDEAFRDAFKDIKDMFPKSLRDDAKDYFKEWHEGQQDVDKVAHQLNFVNASFR